MEKKCRIEGCEGGISNIKRQLCQKHYRKQQAAGLDRPSVIGESASTEGLSLQDQKTQEEVEKLRLQNGELRGQLRRVEDVDATWIDFIATLRTGLEAMPGRVKTHCTEVVSPAVISALRMAIDDCAADLGVELDRKNSQV